MTGAVFAGESVAYPGGDRIEQVVLGHAARQPDAVALRWREQSVTYGELAARAARTAAALTESGVRPGDVVTVWMDLNPELIVTLLGVLMTGAAYSGLPSDWPIGRIVHCVQTCESRLIVSDLPAAGAHIADVPVLRPGQLRSPVPLPAPVDADGTVPWCVFLTSGSTGAPKAVASPHRGIIRLVHDARLRVDANTVSLVRAPTAWDGFAFELWLPLLAGGSCVLGNSGPPTTAEVRALIERGVNWMMLASSLFGVLVEDGVECLAGARTIVVGGERMAPQHAAACLAAHPDLNLINAYGPVEGCAYVTAHVVGDESGEIPIGTTAPNTTVYLLDPQRQVIPCGERGEVAVSGDGVALCYLGNEAETAAKFPTLLLDGEPVRVYLTGDLAIADENGVLRFEGRADRQVKIRGVRIELDEVERAIATVEGVGQAAVLGLPPSSLTAFYSGLDGAGPPADVVRAALADVLPPSYLPDRFVPVSTMPLTSNGKTDAAALCAMLPSMVDDVAELRGVLGTVVRTAAELLGFVPAAEMDLFANGASSLTAVRLANRLTRDLGCDVTGADVLAARTSSKLADVVSQLPRRAVLESVAVHTDGPTRIQSGVRFLEQAMPGGDDLLCPAVYVIRGELDPERLRAALLSVVAEHDALRTKLRLDLRTGEVSADVVTVDELLVVADPVDSSDEALAAATAFVRRRFQLDEEIPVRAVLQPFDGGSVLGIGSHQVALDGWSLEHFARTLTERYQRPEVVAPTRYADVFAAQEATLDPVRRSAATIEWRKRLAGIPAPAIGRRLGAIRPGPVRELDLGINAEVAAEMDRWAAARDQTAFAGYLAAYVSALHKVFGLESVPVNVPVVGRTLPEAEGVIGPFANNVVLGLRDLGAGTESIADSVAEQMRAVLDCQLLDFDDVLGDLVPATEVWNTFYQVNFVVQDNEPDVLRFPSARTEFVRVPPRSSTMKLRMELWLASKPQGRLVYRTDCVRDDEAQRVVEEIMAGLRVH